MTFNKWASIGNFHNVRKTIDAYELHVGPVTYRGKIKLHGTNGGIIVSKNGDVFAQSRSSIIGTGNDNCGFSAWVEQNKDVWVNARDGMFKQITIYGEWVGKGIQKGVSITQVDGKHFAIFAIQLGDYDENGNAPMIIDPTVIKNWFADKNVVLPDNVHILPWYGDDITFDFNDVPSMEAAVEIMNSEVAIVEKCDPWVKEVFGIEGVGEGIVYNPINFVADDMIDRWHLSTFMIKAKGEKHKVQKDRAAVIIDPEVVANINEFVDKFATVQRFEQGTAEINRGEMSYDFKLIGPFLGWVSKDIAKESNDELKVSGLEWRQVNKTVTSRAREWYLSKIAEF